MVNPLALAPAIYGPSYVSFESALAWHGLIPERVEEVVCATLKRLAEFETPLGRYRYRHVSSRFFSIGIERVEDPLLPWLLASPTKALCESVALDDSIRSQKDVRAWLEAIRIEDLPSLDQEQPTACAACYGRPAVRHLAHLEARMRQSGDWPLETPLDTPRLRKRLEERFASIRFDQAKENIAPFLKDPRELSLQPEKISKNPINQKGFEGIC